MNEEVEAIWYARLPNNWADPPEWMSFSRLREIEVCPRRWSLNSTSYPQIWPHRGYPPRIYLAALSGQIIHAALETIINALNRAGGVSITDENFVQVMRNLGGYTKIIEETVKSICNNLQDNPRFTSKFKYISTKLRTSVPMLREQLQIWTGKLRPRSSFVSTMASGSQSKRARVRSVLSNGTHSEVELRVDSLRWRGFVDALILSDANCEIIDYKTGLPKPEHQEQVRLYSLLWTRDKEINPTGRTVDRLTLAYSTGDVAVEPPLGTQLDILEQEIILRTKAALSLAQQTPPSTVPNIHNCRYCPVRQLCDDYWTPQVQQILAQEVLCELPVRNEDFIDLEIDSLKQQTPLSWSAVVLLCRTLPARSQILIKLSESASLLQDIFSRGTRIRILDALLTNQSEDVTIPIIHLTKMSEAFIV